MSFTNRIQEYQAGGFRLFVLQTEVEDVVSWKGSFITNPVFEKGEEMLQSLSVAMLDKGTRQRDKFQIAELLENKGARISHRSRVLRVGFSGKALKHDFEEVMEVAAEQLRAPSFDPVEYEKVRVRREASIRRSINKSATRAWTALSRQIYSSDHPNYVLSPEEELEQLESISVENLQAYYDKHFGADEAVLVVVGDIEPEAVADVVRKNFEAWPSLEAPALYQSDTSFTAPEQLPVNMPDKVNIDVRMGHPLSLRSNDEDFVALYIANFIVGGNFSSRLMDIVRDEKGLTYGVHSSLNGVNRFYSGHWQVSITLSQDRLQEGIQATSNVLLDYVQEGASSEELDEKKKTITGSYKVRLATTNGLAASILRGIERGFGKEYIDNYSGRVEAVTLDRLNAIIRNHFDPKTMHVAMAGTLKG